MNHHYALLRTVFCSMLVLLININSALPQEAADKKLPVPRFVSLKSDRVNVRQGPTKDHAVIYTYKKLGLPVEIIAEFETWRRIRDSEGEEGWVLQNLLAGKRTVLVAPWQNKEKLVPLYARPDVNSAIKAKLEPNVLGYIKNCNQKFCRIIGDEYDGYVAQEQLWGVYPNETVDE